MPDFRKQFGLDYLRGSDRSDGPLPSVQSPADALLDKAVIAYGWPMLNLLRRSPHATADLYSLIDQLQIPIEDALKVMDIFAKRGYLTIVKRDLKGNHELQLTDAGDQFLG